MKILLYLFYFFRSAILRGLLNTLRLLRAEMTYEKEFRIRTTAIKPSHSKEFFHYQGASYLVLLRMFAEIHKQTSEFDFVDIGSGKGRAAFVAEYCGYNTITGIELDAELVMVSLANLEFYPFKRAESQIRFIHANALSYDYKNRPTVYFLFNPFNQEILEKVLDRISALTRSETWFIYMNPLYPSPFRQRHIVCFKEIKTRFYTEALIFKMKAK